MAIPEALNLESLTDDQQQCLREFLAVTYFAPTGQTRADRLKFEEPVSLEEQRATSEYQQFFQGTHPEQERIEAELLEQLTVDDDIIDLEDLVYRAINEIPLVSFDAEKVMDLSDYHSNGRLRFIPEEDEELLVMIAEIHEIQRTLNNWQQSYPEIDVESIQIWFLKDHSLKTHRETVFKVDYDEALRQEQAALQHNEMEPTEAIRQTFVRALVYQYRERINFGLQQVESDPALQDSRTQAINRLERGEAVTDIELERRIIAHGLAAALNDGKMPYEVLARYLNTIYYEHHSIDMTAMRDRFDELQERSQDEAESKLLEDEVSRDSTQRKVAILEEYKGHIGRYARGEIDLHDVIIAACECQSEPSRDEFEDIDDLLDKADPEPESVLDTERVTVIDVIHSPIYDESLKKGLRSLIIEGVINANQFSYDMFYDSIELAREASEAEVKSADEPTKVLTFPKRK